MTGRGWMAKKGMPVVRMEMVVPPVTWRGECEVRVR
jgi:hypothetical protein